MALGSVPSPCRKRLWTCDAGLSSVDCVPVVAEDLFGLVAGEVAKSVADIDQRAIGEGVVSNCGGDAM